jgi:hypothetical protein
MLGKNTLVINHAEMVRAMNKYFKELIPIDERGNEKVISVRQKGAQPQKDFIIELDVKP